MENEREQLDITDYISKICKKYGITEEQLKSKSRLNLLVSARVEIAKRLKKEGLSYPSIGMILGYRDHTTIIHYMNKKRRK